MREGGRESKRMRVREKGNEDEVMWESEEF